MKTVSLRQDQGIPGVYGLLLLDVVSRWGYNAETLFSPFQLTSEQLAEPEFRIPVHTANELVKLASLSLVSLRLAIIWARKCVFQFMASLAMPL